MFASFPIAFIPKVNGVMTKQNNIVSYFQTL